MKARIGPGDKLLSFVQNQYRKLDSKQHRIVLIVEEMDAKFFKRDLKDSVQWGLNKNNFPTRTVWPDAGIKIVQSRPKVAQKLAEEEYKKCRISK